MNQNPSYRYAVSCLCNSLLNDSDPSVRCIAANALAKCGGEDAIDALGQALSRDASVEVRKAAAEAIGDILALAKIQDLLAQLQKQGMTAADAQNWVAEDLANQAQKNPTLKDKLVKWGQSLGDATVTDVVKGVVKLALRAAGLPIP